MEKQAIGNSGSEVHFAKVVANPTPLSWSQIYNAGSLFAVLSLNYNEVSGSDIPVLSAVGKDVFNSLEEEFFTLEEKTFLAVKESIVKSLEKVPPSVTASFIIATIPPGKDHILYLYLLGKGSILLKRGEKVGDLLKGTEELQSASGILEDKDLLVLQTDEFSEKIPHDALVSSLDLPPSDVAEVFGAKIHQGSEGKEAALILMYYKKKIEEEFALPVLSAETESEEITISPTLEKNPDSTEFFSSRTVHMQKAPFSLDSIKTIAGKATATILSFVSNKTQGMPLQLGHKRKIYLTIAILLIGALLISGFLAIRKQQDAKLQTEVESVLSTAQQKYNEGEVLAGLNKNLAREDFEQAKEILESNKSKFPEGSTQRQEIDALLTKVNAALAPLSDTIKLTPKEVSLEENPLLMLSKAKNADFVTRDENALYYLNKDGVFSTALSGQSQKSLVQSEEWEKATGIGVFGSNLYVLDAEENQIYKFVPAGSSYSKSNYVTSEADLSGGRSIAIDGSIWVLQNNGSVKKFTRGKEETFSIANLPSAFSDPIRIFTNADTNNLYILDKGNARIVLIAKNGTYSSQLQADILKDAKDFDVNEKEKTIHVLSKDKLYELPLP